MVLPPWDDASTAQSPLEWAEDGSNTLWYPLGCSSRLENRVLLWGPGHLAVELAPARARIQDLPPTGILFIQGETEPRNSQCLGASCFQRMQGPILPCSGGPGLGIPEDRDAGLMGADLHPRWIPPWVLAPRVRRVLAAAGSCCILPCAIPMGSAAPDPGGDESSPR